MIDLLLLLLLVFGNAFITRVHIVSYLCVILCRLFSPQSANFLIRFQLFLAIQTFSSSTHSTGRPCDLKALFASDILVKSCGFLMSDLCLSCWTGQAAGSLFILPIFVSPHQQRTRCKFANFGSVQTLSSDNSRSKTRRPKNHHIFGIVRTLAFTWWYPGYVFLYQNLK